MSELSLALDHVTLSVDDLDRAKAFYRETLAPLGLALVAEISAAQSGSVAHVGFGFGRKGILWLAAKGRQSPPAHICFRAKSREAVRAFHTAGSTAGGTDHGPPGVREAYHPEYYAAFLLDPEGHNIEAVCFADEVR